MSPQSQTPSQTNGHHNELRGVRTYRGRKLEDLIPQIREELGPDAIIGLSTHSEEQIAASAAADVDHISVGPIWETPTKA